MATKLYNPFLDFKFDNKTCFLTGQELQSPDEQIQVFPVWMMRAFDLEEKPFKMLDESFLTYKQLQLPSSVSTALAFENVERQVEQAMGQGFDAVKKLDEITLFQWVSKILYGVVFNEIQVGIRQALLSGEPMNFSQALVHKFRNLHAMLQSIVVPMEFEHKNPFSIQVFSVENAPETFLYRDEINTLVFSLRMNDFAIIATLQDNGTHSIYHEEILKKVVEHKLHPIQFEEICARYFYSAYLFNRLPEYTYMETPQKVYVEPMPLNDFTLKPIFDSWAVKTYGQVLENFWKPWGYLLFEIIKNPETPMSFLTDEQQNFLEKIDLPLN
ncbi:hypothetical protein FAZ19_05655 [Sphingobacterium alkalisoli]|uniref:Uncharacterized protein n=1 Tax=Sphingobacterium alkalisoli TaxID=1874115 RepID=A0A4V5LZ27_9SPHI|nr:hypothetical protein [Sphingobacterium alkalisoli]TJY68739.1 hypothetical protein FAZ19_05655 [Sphingobacterium alkalisoli]GGH04430.1 hypothetical protein GCM10011418_00090 [Sphingobacterium alkalisoli]